MKTHRTWPLVATSIAIAALAGCASRTSFARYPGAAKKFNPANSDPKAVTIANQVLAAAGGPANWAKAKQLRWKEAIVHDGKVISGEQAWDRWNGRLYGRLDGPKGTALVVMAHLYKHSGAAFAMTPGGAEHRLPTAMAQKALATSQRLWKFASIALCMPFLLKAPGTRLKYVGPVKDDSGQPDLQDVQVTFDPADKTRAGTVYHAIVNKNTHVIVRLEVQKKQGLVGYALKNWVTVNGLKFPTLFQNLGYKSEHVQMKDIRVSTSPDDSLYVPSVSATRSGG